MKSEVFEKFKIPGIQPTQIKLETITGDEIETEGQMQLPLDGVGY